MIMNYLYESNVEDMKSDEFYSYLKYLEELNNTQVGRAK